MAKRIDVSATLNASATSETILISFLQVTLNIDKGNIRIRKVCYLPHKHLITFRRPAAIDTYSFRTREILSTT